LLESTAKKDKNTKKNMFNLIQIKRRLLGQNINGGVPSLSSGELAYNENSNELYYGHTNGTITIAGSGAFVDRTSAQTISGDKTFIDLTTLGSTIFSTGATIDAGGNVIGNLAAPLLSSDAATRGYVDDATSSNTSALTSLSAEVYNNFVEKIESEAVILNGGLTVTNGITADTLSTSSDAEVGGNLTVTGNLSVLGTQVVVNTETVNISGTSTQIDIINNGTGTGLTVNQTGNEDVAEFKDEGITALIIKGDSATPGYVGVGTATPNEKLTVAGNLSASGTIYSGAGLEIDTAGTTTLYASNNKVGVNTETPNEALTVVGNISASGDIYATNGNFSGTVNLGSLDVGCFSVDSTGNVDTCGTLYVGGASTFASTVSAQGALTIDGSSTLNGAVTINNTLQVTSTVDLDSTLNVDGATTLQSTLSGVGAATFDSSVSVGTTLDVGTSGTIGTFLTVGTDLSGTASVSRIVDFIIDGGVF
jgi:hypothetical protein